MTDWIYQDNFETVSTVTNWLSVGGFVCCCFLLLSFLCLPIARTSRHYLTIGLVSGVALVNLGFIVALWAKPAECHDAITVNDMYTSLACAWSGALLLFGGQSAVMWVFNRSLSLHLQICWSRVPGKKSFYAAQLVGWGVPAIVTGVSLSLSGVAFRFGNVCHINHDNSIATFWGPTLVFAAVAAVLQFITLGYVCRVYLRKIWDPRSNSAASSNMRAGTPNLMENAFRQKSVRATYRRVKKVLALQWRGIVVVMIVLASAVYFAAIFNIFDQLGTVAIGQTELTYPWVTCIVLSKGDKSQCIDKARNFSLNETVVSAVLVLLSVMGYWCLLFLGRISMFIGWWDLVKKLFKKSDGFASIDARKTPDGEYAMFNSPPQSYHLTKSAKGGLVATAKPLRLNTVTLSSIEKEILKHKLEDSPADSYNEPQIPSPVKSNDGRESSLSQLRELARSSSRQNRVAFDDEKDSIDYEQSWPQPNTRQPYSQYHQSASPMDQINEYTPRQNNPHTNPARSLSLNSQQRRSSSALSRDRPSPAMRITPSPNPYQSNSRRGPNSALSSRPSL